MSEEKFSVSAKKNANSNALSEEEHPVSAPQSQNSNAPSEYDPTLLHQAAVQGDLERVKSIGTGFFLVFWLKMCDEDGNTPLHLAASNGHWQIVEYFIDHGAAVNLQNTKWNTPLHLAARSHEQRTVAALFKSKSLLYNRQNKEGKTPLHLASQSGDLDIVKYLILQKVNGLIPDARGNTPLHIACAIGDVDIVKALADKYPRAKEMENSSGHIPLCMAIPYGHFEGVIQLFAKTILKEKYSLLRTAAFYNKLSIVEYLVQNGADLKINESNRRSTGFIQDTDKEGRNRNTPLHLACMEGHLEVVKYLVDNSTPFLINLQNKEGNTPLHLACMGGHTGIITFLSGKNITSFKIANKAGFTPLSLVPTKEPIKPPSDEPIEPSDDPIQPSDDPIQPSNDPIQLSDEPIQPSNDPIQLSDEPIKPSDDPIKPSNDPIQLSDEPIQRSDEPIQRSDEPIQPLPSASTNRFSFATRLGAIEKKEEAEQVHRSASLNHN